MTMESESRSTLSEHGQAPCRWCANYQFVVLVPIKGRGRVWCGDECRLNDLPEAPFWCRNFKAKRMNIKTKRKLLGLWRSRTARAGVVLGFIVTIQPALMAWLNYKLAPADYALAGVIITGVIWLFRWVTNSGLEDKGK